MSEKNVISGNFLINPLLSIMFIRQNNKLHKLLERSQTRYFRVFLPFLNRLISVFSFFMKLYTLNQFLPNSSQFIFLRIFRKPFLTETYIFLNFHISKNLTYSKNEQDSNEIFYKITQLDLISTKT